VATVNVNLYCLWQSGKLITSPTDRTQATLPAIVAGDTWQIKEYFLNEDLTNHRFAGSSVSARIRAAGNNHGYADAAGSELVPSPPSVTRSSAGTSTAAEIQVITFPVQPVSGSFRIVFSGAGSGSRGGGTSLEGTANLSFQSGASGISQTIQEIKGYYQGNDGPYTWAELSARYGSAVRAIGVAVTTYSGSPDAIHTITIQFGDVFGGANWWNTGIHLVTLSDEPPAPPLQYSDPYGWAITLPFTASDFADYLIPANGPSYFEIMRDGAAAVSIQLTAGPVGNSVPAFTNGPPPDSVGGAGYDFQYTASGFPDPTFSVTSGTLPTGVSLSSDGHLTGTPVQNGTFSGVVTASNIVGSATQSFSFTIHNVIVPFQFPGPGSPNLGVFYDGDFSTAKAAGDFRFSQPDSKIPNGFVVRQEFWQLRSSWRSLAIGSAIALSGQNWYLIEETELRDMGGGVCAWDRVYATIPNSWSTYSTIPKTIKYLFTMWSGSTYLTAAIVSTTKTVRCQLIYDYSLNIPGLPGVPDAVLYNVGTSSANSVWLVDGWPQPSPGAPNSNNEGRSFIQGDIGIYMGPIQFRKQVFGPA
jgi:hypothetical protein